MNKRSLEKIARRRHRREKATIDHLAEKMYEQPHAAEGLKKSTTDKGLSIEGQVRKKWDPKKGLPIFYAAPPGKLPSA
jgi:hypothetical protein